MHPGVSHPLGSVTPSGGVDLCGVHLQAGTVVGVSPAVIHRRRDIFGQDVESFRPELWLVANEERIKVMDRHNLSVSRLTPRRGDAVRECIETCRYSGWRPRG